jgi:hypothetical protein
MSKFKKTKTSNKETKFQRRSEGTLQKAYENREKRSSGITGKTIFNTGRMEEYGVLEKKMTSPGEYYFNILPISFDTNISYFEEVPVHMNCGIDNDHFICMERYSEEKCFRCSIQKKGWRSYNKNDPKQKNALVGMFPSDRCIYLIQDVTEKNLEDGEIDENIYIWNAPKKGAHEELQDSVRDKKTQRILDISDMSEDNDTHGRIVYMKVTVRESVDDKTKQKKKFPQYGSFSLVERDDPIPDSIKERLQEIIEAAEEDNGKNAVQFLLHYPEEGEIEESMKSENFEIGEDNENDEPPTRKPFVKKQKKEMNLEELREELEEKSKIKIKVWAKENNLWDEIIDDSLNKEEMIEAIIEHYENQ